MVLTTYPLLSFAVCADANAAQRFQAKQRWLDKNAKYFPDGRLFISFRCRTAIGSKLGIAKSPIPHEGDWAAWVGRYDLSLIHISEPTRPY